VLLLVLALFLAGLSTGAALLSEAYSISPAWLLSFWTGIGFLGAIGKTCGFQKLKSPAFRRLLSCLAGFTRWRVFIRSRLFGFPVLPAFLVAELFVAFMTAIWLFGSPAKSSSDSSTDAC
jgi:hypothetical protein